MICVELSCVLNFIFKDEKLVASQHVSKNDLKVQCTVCWLGSVVGNLGYVPSVSRAASGCWRSQESYLALGKSSDSPGLCFLCCKMGMTILL